MIAALAVLASLVADAIVFYVVGELFAAGYSDDHGIGAVSPVTFTVLVLAAFWIPRGLEFLDLSSNRGYAVNGVLMFLLVYGAMRIEFAGDIAIWDFGWAIDFVTDVGETPPEAGPAFVGGSLIIAAWVRGAWRSAGDFELESVARQLTVPFAVVVTVCVLAAWTDRIDIIGRGAIAFFAAAVLALAFSQSALSGATIGSVRSGGMTGMLLGATTIATAVCVLIFGIVFGFLGQQFGGLIESAVYVVLLVILTPIAWVMEIVFGWLLGGINVQEAFDPPSAFVDSDETTVDDRSTTERTFLGFWRVLMLLIALSIIGGAIALVTRLYRRSRRSAGPGPTSATAGSLGEDLRGLFRRPFGGRRAPEPGEGAAALYRRVLDEGQRSGRPRADFETPGEYAPALTGLFHIEVTDEITAAFVEARYAGRDPDPARLRELERRWEERRD